MRLTPVVVAAIAVANSRGKEPDWRTAVAADAAKAGSVRIDGKLPMFGGGGLR